MEETLTMKEVLAMVGLSRTSVYRQIENGVFPRPIKRGERSIYWLKSEIKMHMGNLVVSGIEGYDEELMRELTESLHERRKTVNHC